MSIEDVARICHEANRAYCLSQGDLSQLHWEDAAQWQRDSAIAGVCAFVRNPDLRPEETHVKWCQHKEADGWVYGPNKDADKKTHPCLVPYEELPWDQKLKDALFGAVVRVFLPELDAAELVTYERKG